VNHEILLKIIKRKIVDKRTFWLIKEIVCSNRKKQIKGIPIGNLTSQLFANIYLNELDQLVKHELKAKHYIRYMDDFLFLDTDKKKLHQFKNRIRGFLSNRLELKFHPQKAEVFLVVKGIDFLGYVINGDYKLLRKSTVKRFSRRTKKKIQEIKLGNKTQQELSKSIDSFMAYASYGNSWNLRKHLIIDCCKRSPD